MKLLKTKWIAFCVMLMLVFGMSIHTQAATYYEENGFYYSLEFGKAYVEGYYGTNPVMRIPTTLGGCTVVGINSVKNGTVRNYEKYVQELYIPDTVTEVAYDSGRVNFGSKILRKVRFSSNINTLPIVAFSGCKSLEVLENTVGLTSIDYETFRDCTSLKSVSFPNVTSTGMSIFKNCTSLISVDMPKLQVLGAWSFTNCESLSQVNMPSLTEIGGESFYKCSSLTAFTIPSTCKKIEYYAFAGTSITNITIPANVTYLGHTIFRDCTQLRSAVIYAPITHLYGEVFKNCTSLTSVTLPDTLQRINGRTFENCKSLQTIRIPASVTSIDNSAFDGCERLTMMYVYEGTAGEAFAKAKGIPYKSEAIRPEIILDKSKATLYLTKGYKQTKLNVTKRNTTLNVTFKSSKPSVASVSSNGTITAKKAGKTKITATCGTLKKSCTIIVKNPTLKVSTKSVTLKRGREKAIQYSLTPVNAKIKFKSTNKKIAAVSSSGIIKAKKKGRCYIEVSLNDIVVKTIKVKVKK